MRRNGECRNGQEGLADVFEFLLVRPERAGHRRWSETLMTRTNRGLFMCAASMALALGLSTSWAEAPMPISGAGGVRAAGRARRWIKTSDKNGILTFKREVRASPIIALRGEGLVDAPIVRVASVLLDYDRATEWVDSLEEVRVVRMLSPNEFIEYDHVGTPPIIMVDRDFVCRGRVDVDLQEKSLTMNLWPASDPAAPVGRYIRGTLRGYWKLKAVANGTKTYVTTEMHGDPKGSVAKWLVNLFQKGWPRNTLQSLREQVAKRDIAIIPQVKAVFEGKPLQFAIKQKAPLK
jgi:hypothetical protein